MLCFNILDVKNIRLVFVCIFVNLSLDVFRKLWMSIESVNNELKDQFIVFLCSFVLGLIKGVEFSAGIFDIADMEETSCIRKWGIFVFESRD